MIPFKFGINPSGLGEKSHVFGIRETMVMRRGTIVEAVDTAHETHNNTSELAFMAQITHGQVKLDASEATPIHDELVREQGMKQATPTEGMAAVQSPTEATPLYSPMAEESNEAEIAAAAARRAIEDVWAA